MKKTLNAVLRRWLDRLARRDRAKYEYRKLMRTLTYVCAGRKFDRDEMNARTAG